MLGRVPTVEQLRIYPIKALDPVTLNDGIIVSSGAISGDRAFAIVDANGNFVNGKRNAKIHALRSQFDLNTMSVSLYAQDSTHSETFHIEQDRHQLEAWLTNYFEFSVHIIQNFDGFPDDTTSPGPTIISTATLETVASWFPDLTVEDVRLRFRANIEISGIPAFWEDQLFAKEEAAVHFQIGDVQFVGVNPCQRCVVVTRNPQTGEAYPNFQKIFLANRQETLPNWVERSRFNHFFRLAINTRVPASEQGKSIHIGDEIKILESISHPG